MEDVRFMGLRIRIHPIMEMHRDGLTLEERMPFGLAMLHVSRGIESYMDGYFARKREEKLPKPDRKATDVENNSGCVDMDAYSRTSDAHYAEAEDHFSYASLKFGELERLATTEGVAERANRAAVTSKRIALRMAKRVINTVDQQASERYL